MKHVNIEIKARCDDLRSARRILKRCGAVRRGVDHQIDTYFSVPNGRLKLREGRIENSLIHYDRGEDDRLRLSDITRCDTGNIGRYLKEVLSRGLPTLATVDKKREIYFVDNVKFHLDRVVGLGTFLEIEAIDVDGNGNVAMLRRQCDEFIELLGIRDADLVRASYSDMILSEHAEHEPVWEAAA
jgi:adenylate cyclase, class 2